MNRKIGDYSEVVYLRNSTEADAALLWQKAYSDQQFMQKFRAQDRVSSLEALRLRMIRAKQMPFVSNGFREFIIEHREFGPVGLAVLANYNYENQEAEFLTGVWQEDKGLIGAGAAANMLLWEYCFKQLKLERIYALVYSDNKKPQKILSAMGLTKSVEKHHAGKLVRFELSRNQYTSNNKLAALTKKVFGRDFTDMVDEQVNDSKTEKVNSLNYSKPQFPKVQGKRDFVKNTAVATAMMSVPWFAQAVEFNVTEAQDDGTGMVTSTLSWAILQANTAAGSDLITLNTDVTLTGVMKRLIDSDVVIQSDGTQRTISGANNYRPLFIKSGTVEINNLRIINGRAQGGATSKGGPGAGLGGGLFVYDGDVTLTDVEMNNHRAIGVSRYESQTGPYGGGGMGGNANDGNNNGGGLFTGNYGGFGAYQNLDSRFGAGGTNSGAAGFGGGGYGDEFGNKNGGFGGGGGKSFDSVAGNGGFGAGGGGSALGQAGNPGFGASNAQSAGLGGAVFIRSGGLYIERSSFSNNQANGFRGLGGALFVLHRTTNTNGNNQGMPLILANVNGCQVTFSNNSVNSASINEVDDDDIYDSAGLIGAGAGFDPVCADDIIFQDGFEVVDPVN